MGKGHAHQAVRIFFVVLAMVFISATYQNCGHLKDTGLPVASQTLNSNSLNPPPLKFVQLSYGNAPAGAASSASVTMTKAQLAGDLNVVVIGWNDAAATIVSVADTSGNSYIQANSLLRFGTAASAAGSALSQTIFYAPNIKGAADGQNQVTVTFDVSAMSPDVRVTEYSGFGPAVVVDAHGGTSGNTLTPTSPAINVASSNELLFVGNTTIVGNVSGTNAYNLRVITPLGNLVEDLIAPVIGVYQPVTLQNSSGPWIIQSLVFK